MKVYNILEPCGYLCQVSREKWLTVPETNSSPLDGCSKIYIFLLGPGQFSGANCWFWGRYMVWVKVSKTAKHIFLGLRRSNHFLQGLKTHCHVLKKTCVSHRAPFFAKKTSRLWSWFFGWVFKSFPFQDSTLRAFWLFVSPLAFPFPKKIKNPSGSWRTSVWFSSKSPDIFHGPHLEQLPSRKLTWNLKITQVEIGKSSEPKLSDLWLPVVNFPGCKWLSAVGRE